MCNNFLLYRYVTSRGDLLSFKFFSQLIMLVLLFISFGAYAMSINDIGKQCLFSSFSGAITLNGKPVNGAKIKRVAYRSHTKGDKTDYATTNEQGEFAMPAVWDRNIVGKFLPMEFAAAQEVFVYFEGQEYQIWNGVKRQKEENTESNGEELNIQCELTSEFIFKSVNGNKFKTRCTWAAKADAPFVIDLPVEDN